jgi:hypothetical protein
LERISNPMAKKLIVIDACRTDAYVRCPSRSSGDGSGLDFSFRALGRNDRQVEPMIVSSTRPGSFALDHVKDQPLSPFATHWTKRMEAHPHLVYQRLIHEVANDVANATNGLQRPQIVSGGGPVMCLKGRACTWQ